MLNKVKHLARAAGGTNPTTASEMLPFVQHDRLVLYNKPPAWLASLLLGVPEH